MDEQEVVKQIRELQEKRTSLKEQDTVLVLKIMELKDVLRSRKDVITLILMVYSAKSMILKVAIYMYMS